MTVPENKVWWIHFSLLVRNSTFFSVSSYALNCSQWNWLISFFLSYMVKQRTLFESLSGICKTLRSKWLAPKHLNKRVCALRCLGSRDTVEATFATMVICEVSLKHQNKTMNGPLWPWEPSAGYGRRFCWIPWKEAEPFIFASDKLGYSVLNIDVIQSKTLCAQILITHNLWSAPWLVRLFVGR